MSGRLRVQHLVIQTVLVEDTGDELLPGPAVKPVVLPLSQVPDFLNHLPEEVAALQAQRDKQEPTEAKE